MTRTDINICLIGCKSKDFIEHLAIIRHIDGIKVLKRRKKPFYDITGVIDSEETFLKLGNVLSYLITECEAELAIDNDDLRHKIFEIV